MLRNWKAGIDSGNLDPIRYTPSPLWNAIQDRQQTEYRVEDYEQRKSGIAA